MAAVGSALGLFHALVSVALLTCIRADPDMAIVTREMDAWIILACLSTAWILAFFQKGTFSLRHVGTRFYGRRQTHQGYITTKWLVALFPLLPIRSYVVAYRIKEESNPEYEFQQNAMQPVPGYFLWAQMARTALISYGTILWCLGCFWLMFIGPCI